MRSWTRVRSNIAFGARAQVFSFFDCCRRHFDAYPNSLGYISDTYQCAPVLCLEAVPEAYPPPLSGTPLLFDHSRLKSRGITREKLNGTNGAEFGGRFSLILLIFAFLF